MLHGQVKATPDAPEPVMQNSRMIRNLQNLIHEAKSMHNSASTIVANSRSTAGNGSVFGNPLSEEKYSSTEKWIAPPAIHEDEAVQSASRFDIKTIDSFKYESLSDQEPDADLNI
jgi:hypothetical protein